jgi:hypothetical protein
MPVSLRDQMYFQDASRLSGTNTSNSTLTTFLEHIAGVFQALGQSHRSRLHAHMDGFRLAGDQPAVSRGEFTPMLL